MPIYEYECKICDKRSEVERKMSERFDDQPCVHCGAINTVLAPSLGAFVLKGSGWYASDQKVQKGSTKKT